MSAIPCTCGETPLPCPVHGQLDIKAPGGGPGGASGGFIGIPGAGFAEDAEIAAMKRLIGALNGLSEPARRRVIQWALDRWGG